MARKVKSGSRISPREADRMYKLWLECGNYSKVAKFMHRSPSAVAKHVQIRVALELQKEPR